MILVNTLPRLLRNFLPELLKKDIQILYNLKLSLVNVSHILSNTINIISHSIEVEWAMKKTIVILVHVFVLWALCAATIGICMAFNTVENAIMAHAIFAPIIAVTVSLIYFSKFNYTTALKTATVLLLS